MKVSLISVAAVMLIASVAAEEHYALRATGVSSYSILIYMILSYNIPYTPCHLPTPIYLSPSLDFRIHGRSTRQL